MAKVHVIPHTHWDREWYFTQQDSDVLAAYNFTKVIETLETQPEYSCYHLDGQSSIVEDYLKVLPHMRDRLAALVKEKKLFIGPWYTQTDTYNVAGESIIRNLKYGMHIADKLGHSMNVGYLPDTFGHNAQMPTLFAGAGIDNIVFWRGIDYDQQVERSNFMWRSAGGDEIVAYNLVHGYGAAKNVVPAQFEHKIFPMVEKIKQLAGLNEVLIPSGGDQVNIDPELPVTLAKATEQNSDGDVYAISSMEDYVEYLKANNQDFETYLGEFKAPRYTRIHKTIGSVRYDIKKLNFEIEQFLLKKLEPVIAIAKAHGIIVHTELVDIAWKKILECHAHDSMGGCNSDATNADIMHRLAQAEQTCHGLYNLVVKELATSACNPGEVMLFNSRVQPYSGLCEVVVFSQHESVQLCIDGKALNQQQLNRETLDGGKVIEVTKDGEKEVEVPAYYRFELAVDVENLPALGYQVCQLEAGEISQTTVGVSSTIGNQALSLSFAEGELTLSCNKSGRKVKQLLSFEQQADDGDSYDFSPLEGDTPLYSQSLELLGTKAGELKQQMTLRATLQAPKTLEDRLSGDNLAEMVFDITLTLRAQSQQLEVTVDTDNSLMDHRVRVLIGSDVVTGTSIATQPFALMEREIGADISGWRDSFRECPVDIETTDGSVALVQEEKAVVITGRGIKEYQILPGEAGHQIALTLFKSTGKLGKDDLLWRPGRASGINNTVVYTPDAQLQKPMQFEFAVALTSDAAQTTVRALEADYLSQPFAYQRQSLNSFENRLERFQVRFDEKPLPSQWSLLEVGSPLEISSIGHSFNKADAVVLRLFNPTEDQIELTAESFANCRELEVVNYREQRLDSQELVVRSNNSIDLLLTLTQTGTGTGK